MKQIRIALAGLGGVGRTVAEMLLERQERWRQTLDLDVRLVAVCGSRAGRVSAVGLTRADLDALQPGVTGVGAMLSPDSEGLSGAKPDILIEAGPTNYRTGQPGSDYLCKALQQGISCVVVSKGALVREGLALRELAVQSGADLRLSGAAAAALPALDLLQISHGGVTILRVEGILNATTNFLLDSMRTEGLSYEAALAEAKRLGFAEADPTNDVEGWDSAAKLILLANFGLGLDLRLEDVRREGIGPLAPEDLRRWKAEGLVPKLVASLDLEGEAPRASVAVRLYDQNDPFASVSGKAKALRIVSREMGELVCTSNADEPRATAASVLKDLESLLKSR